jgi:D-serine deaminase-like pyridoxal phosphate-dependent protein
MSEVRIDALSTPAFLVDRAVLEANCTRMREKASLSGVAFRPHVKTHKSLEIGRIQHGGGTGPITVSTVAEAEGFARGGFEDITYAVPIAPDKLERCAALARRIGRLNLLIDHPDALQALEQFARAHQVSFDLFLKVDCGYHRAGVDPDAPESTELARRIAASKAIRFHGLLTHAGHSYHARNREEILEVALQETGVLTEFRRKLGDAAMMRSVGSTPTASVLDRFQDCDEVRPGNYVFYDAFQAAIGACKLADCAVSVLSSVIGSYPDRNTILVDAGALALSKDLGPHHIDPSFGYGLVCDVDLRPLPLRVASVSQEHGQLVAFDVIDFEKHPVGSRLRIIPNHSCLTAALYDAFQVVDQGRVVAEWRPIRGW